MGLRHLGLLLFIFLILMTIFGTAQLGGMLAILIKMTLLGLFIFIFISLCSTLFHLISGTQSSVRTARTLAWHIGLSFFILLFIAFALGWIHPYL